MNWSKVVSNNSYKGSSVDWPEINPKPKSKTTKDIKINLTEMNDISKSLNVLQLSETTVTKYEDNRTREEILADRKLRKKKAKDIKTQEQYECKLKNLRAPKGQKIKVIDAQFLEAYQNKNVASTSAKLCNVFAQKANDGSSVKPVTGHIRIKQILKHKNEIKIDLMGLITQRKSQRQAKEKRRIQVKIAKRKTGQNVIVRHKGKKRDFPKAKWKTPLKRCILAIRKQRRAQLLAEQPTKECELIDLKCQEVENIDNIVENVEEKSVVLDLVSKLKEVLKSDKSEVPEAVITMEKKNVANDDSTIVNIQHSRKFRPYCNNSITPELCKFVEQLLADVFRFQSRAFDKNEIKARAQKRYVIGFKETQRQLDIKKLQLLVIAPDLEPNVGPGGLDETVNHLKCIAEEQNLPYVFAVRRHRLGNIFHKKVPISCLGVIDYSGSEDNFKNIICLLDAERSKYQKANKCIPLGK